MSPASCTVSRAASGFPRVSGDEPGEAVKKLVWGEFSPRERG